MNFRLAIFAVVLLVFEIGFAQAQKPLKVFILVGQSNMQGHAKIGTLEHLGMDPKTAPLLKQLQNEDGSPKVCENVCISYLSSGGEKHGKLTTGFGADENKIGPEFSFGIRMQEVIDEPILIIKTAWGGKSLNTDFRPPSSGPYEFNESQLEQFEKQKKDIGAIKKEKAKATGHFYRLTIEHVQNVLKDIKSVYPQYDSANGYELAGMVWFQGWNDMVDRGTYPNRDDASGYGQYSELLEHFIRDIRKDLEAPKLPFVIGVLGVGGPVDKYLPDQKRYKKVHQNFRNAMAAPAKLPEFKDNVAVVLTESYWDLELTALRAREANINQKLKSMNSESKLSREAQKAARQKLRSEEFSEKELKTLEVGVSNAEYHYLGSAKIMAQIGVGFADALLKLQDQKK